MAVVGLDAIKSLFDHISLGKRLVDYLKNDYKPDLVLLIDYGGFNLRIARELKKRGIEVFYYISPQVWASRKGRIDVIKKYVSKLMLILPFEEKLYKDKNVNAEYVGHPLISQLPVHPDKEEFLKRTGLDPNRKIVGIFPGSRRMEIDYLLPIFLKAADRISVHSKKVQFCLGQAPNISDELIHKRVADFMGKRGIEIKILKNQNHALLANSDVVIAASGTISLEAALYNTPILISYKAPYIAYAVYLMIRYIKFAALPNIIAGKEIIKEFIQHKAKPELIANEALSLLHNTAKREKMIEELKGIREKLGDKVASQEVARIINDYLLKKC
jgi:lipid-A-disaccharide synthase